MLRGPGLVQIILRAAIHKTTFFIHHTCAQHTTQHVPHCSSLKYHTCMPRHHIAHTQHTCASPSWPSREPEGGRSCSKNCLYQVSNHPGPSGQQFLSSRPPNLGSLHLLSLGRCPPCFVFPPVSLLEPPTCTGFWVITDNYCL